MKRLDSKDIQFIDTYLDNSDVIYLDVRLEMVDHIASAIESRMKNGDDRDFYYIFKDYMVDNKTRLLDGFKIHKKKTLNNFFVSLIKSLISLRSIVLSIGFFAFFYLNKDWLAPYLKDRNTWSYGWFFILLFLIAFWTLIRFKIGKNRFMAIEQMFLAMVILTYCFHFFLNIQHIIQKLSDSYQFLFGISILVFVLMIWLNFIFIVQKYVKFYEEKYSTVK